MIVFKLLKKKAPSKAVKILELKERIEKLEKKKIRALMNKNHDSFVTSSLALGILKNELMVTTKENKQK